tara:strand:- start:315 stop:1022 length:708 start_codon:yes stop_codon:yes gene_type:complete
MTVIFAIVKYFVGKKDNKSSVSSTSSIKIITLIYLGLVVLSQFFVNLNTTKKMCGINQPLVAVMTTFIPWIFIFGSINILLYALPGWKAPFSNTFGYLVAKIGGITSLFNKILTSDKQNKMIKEIYEDQSLVINEITPANFDQFWLKFKEGNLLNSGANTYKESLRNLVRLKDIVAEFMWFLFSGLLISSISQNSINNSTCYKNIDVMKKEHSTWEVKKNKKEKKKKKQIYYVRD